MPPRAGPPSRAVRPTAPDIHLGHAVILIIVRQAYSTGGGDPTTSSGRPSKTGKSAVKVINHCGDEILRVYDLAKRDFA